MVQATLKFFFSAAAAWLDRVACARRTAAQAIAMVSVLASLLSVTGISVFSGCCRRVRFKRPNRTHPTGIGCAQARLYDLPGFCPAVYPARAGASRTASLGPDTHASGMPREPEP